MNNNDLVLQEVVDLTTDTGFEKLAAIGGDYLMEEDPNLDMESLVEKQAYAEDSAFADPINRMFSIATPLETKISAIYATKCASVMDPDVLARIKDACNVYGIDVPITEPTKVANALDDPEILAQINAFDLEYDKVHKDDPTEAEKYAHANEYGTELETCLAARAMYAKEEEQVDALEELSKLAGSMDPHEMVTTLHQVDTELGLDTPEMQAKVGTPEYAVFEKVASDTRVNLGNATAPLSELEDYQDDIADLGVSLDWNGENEEALKASIENLPQDVKSEIGSWVK